MPNFYLPSKVVTYLRRLLLHYEHSGPKELAAIIKHGSIAVSPDTDRSWYNGDELFGHDVVIFLTPDAIAPISIKRQEELSEALREDLQRCAKGIAQEYINAVRIELEDENDFLFMMSGSLAVTPATNPDTLSFWDKGEIRVFISHRDSYKREAKALGDALKQFGISCFVAHDTIEPMESWQHQIEKGLETMEVFVALVTDDFHESVWCNQEVGYAKARNVPVICLRLGAAPPGFISDKQALPGEKDHPERSANDLYKILAEKLGKRERLQSALVSAFCETPDWNEARRRFDRLDNLVQKLEASEVARIKDAYESNGQLHNAIYLHTGGGRLRSFLLRTTGQKFVLGSGKMVLEKVEGDEEIPF